jgi:hypothetical protein
LVLLPYPLLPYPLFGEDVHGGGVGPDGCGVDPGTGVADAEVVDEVAGFEVVGAVEDNVGGEEIGGVVGDEVGDVRGDLDAGVDAGEVAAGGFGFGESGAGVVFVEEHLALQVGRLDEIAIDEGEVADARARKKPCGGRAGCAYTNDGDVRMAKELLSSFTDAREEDLTGVTLAVRDGEGERGRRNVAADVRGYSVGGGKRRHASKYTGEDGLETADRRAANPPRAYCICKMKRRPIAEAWCSSAAGYPRCGQMDCGFRI